MRKLSLPQGVTREDALQEAECRLLDRQGAYEGPRLHKRVWGDMMDLYGREWRRHFTVETVSHPAPHRLRDTLPSPRRATGEAEPGLVADVRDAVADLTPEQRVVVELVAFAGLSHRDAAVKLGIREHAVTMRYARARVVLASKLGDYA